MSEHIKEVSFTTDEEKLTRLEALSDALGKDTGEIINEALVQYIEANEWKIAHVNKNPQDNAEETTTGEDSESIFDRFTQPSKG